LPFVFGCVQSGLLLLLLLLLLRLLRLLRLQQEIIEPTRSTPSSEAVSRVRIVSWEQLAVMGASGVS
jgi:hypothetical protein